MAFAARAENLRRLDKIAMNSVAECTVRFRPSPQGICYGFSERLDFSQWSDRPFLSFRSCLVSNNLRGIAEHIRSGRLSTPDLQAVVDKFDPQTREEQDAWYIWRHGTGRPGLIGLCWEGSLLSAMKRGDLRIIAEYLRAEECPEAEVLMWLADQFDPPSPRRSRFIVRSNRRRRFRDPEVAAERLAIGEMVAGKLGPRIPLKAAVSLVASELRLSESTVRRGYKNYRIERGTITFTFKLNA
jgi:hypothetical protein